MKTLKSLMTHTKAALLLLLGATALVLSGCKEDEIPQISLEVDQTPITIGLDTPGQVTVQSNTAWTATVPEGNEWCQITPTSGNGSTEVTITVVDEMDASRTTTILFATAGGVRTASLMVIQNGADGPSLETDNITVPCIISDDGKPTVQFVNLPDGSDVLTTTTFEDSWLHGEVINGVLNISADDNLTNIDRTGTLILQITDPDGNKSYTSLSVTQSALTPVVELPGGGVIYTFCKGNDDGNGNDLFMPGFNMGYGTDPGHVGSIASSSEGPVELTLGTGGNGPNISVNTISPWPEAGVTVTTTMYLDPAANPYFSPDVVVEAPNGDYLTDARINFRYGGGGTVIDVTMGSPASTAYVGQITQAGWYTLSFKFYGGSDGYLACDMTVTDSDGTALMTYNGAAHFTGFSGLYDEVGMVDILWFLGSYNGTLLVKEVRVFPN